MGNQAGFRFGQDGPSRITVVPSMFTEASEIMPVEPVYYPVVPFLPPSISNGAGSLPSGSIVAIGTEVGSDDWKAYPEKLDLFWWQGDDVQIQLIIPGEEDMSAWTWEADVRYWPTYPAHLYYEFVTGAEYFPEVPNEPPLPEGVTPAYNTVTLFLPRQLNTKALTGFWELHSISPYEGPTFPDVPPEGMADDEWPPTTQLKTWIYGNVLVVPRTNNTDVLPGPPPTFEPTTVIISSYGPNGRVP